MKKYFAMLNSGQVTALVVTNDNGSDPKGSIEISEAEYKVLYTVKNHINTLFIVLERIYRRLEELSYE